MKTHILLIFLREHFVSVKQLCSFAYKTMWNSMTPCPPRLSERLKEALEAHLPVNGQSDPHTEAGDDQLLTNLQLQLDTALQVWLTRCQGINTNYLSGCVIWHTENENKNHYWNCGPFHMIHYIFFIILFLLDLYNVFCFVDSIFKVYLKMQKCIILL